MTTADIPRRAAHASGPPIYKAVATSLQHRTAALSCAAFRHGQPRRCSSCPNVDIPCPGNTLANTGSGRNESPASPQTAVRSLPPERGGIGPLTVHVEAELNLDGFAFTGLPLYNGTDAELASYKEKSRLIVSKLSTATGQDKLLVLEGNPAFVDEADFDKLNYIVLNTAELTNVTDLKLQVTGILANSLLSKDKLLLSVQMGGQVIDETGVKQEAVTLMTDRVVALGPLAGLGNLCYRQ